MAYNTINLSYNNVEVNAVSCIPRLLTNDDGSENTSTPRLRIYTRTGDKGKYPIKNYYDVNL